MKKLTALFLASALSLSLAACSGGSSSTAGNTSTGSAGASGGAYDNLEPVTLILADSAAPGAAGALFD